MSGGSWEYLYQRVEEAGERLLSDGDTRRRAFGRHLMLVARALHDIEWVDSCDYGDRDDHRAIDAVVSRSDVLDQAVQDAVRVRDELSALIQAALADGGADGSDAVEHAGD